VHHIGDEAEVGVGVEEGDGRGSRRIHGRRQ
jgi:hypothetical protein